MLTIKHDPHACVWFDGTGLTVKECMVIVDYARGLTPPRYPVPATLRDSVSDLSVRWSNWMDD